MLKKGYSSLDISNDEHDWSDDDYPPGSEIPEDEMNTHVDDAVSNYNKDNEKKTMKSIIDNLLEKALAYRDINQHGSRDYVSTPGHGNVRGPMTYTKETGKPSKFYAYHENKGEVMVGSHEDGEVSTKKIPANKENEKKLKNASLHTPLDNLLEKAWKGSTRQYDVGSSHPSTPNPTSSTSGKDYEYDHRKQELSVSKYENGSQKRLDKRVLATTKENERKLKNASMTTVIDSILAKACYADSVVLLSDSDEEAKKKQKPTSKAPGHTLGCDPLDKRGSDREMVRMKVENLSETDDDFILVRSVDVLIEKAVYGAGASHGKVERGSGKDSSKPGAVRKPELSEERKKQLIEGVQAKAANQASSTGMHSLASKIRAEKSLDERTADLHKSKEEKDAYYTGKHGELDARGNMIRMPSLQSKQKKEVKLNPVEVAREKLYSPHYGKSLDSDLEKSHAKVPSKFFDKPEAERKRIVGEKAWKNYDVKNNEMIRATHAHEKKDVYGKPTGENKSLDERTCDLHKGFAPEKVGGAVGRAYVDNPDSDKAKRVAVKFHDRNADDSEARGKYNEAMTNEVWKHDLKLAKKSLRDVVNMWQTDSAFITKGAKVMPLGPGGEVQTLAKDDSEDEDNGAE